MQEYKIAIYQVIESRVVCWSRLPLGAGGYTGPQLQRLGLKTHVLHTLAHSIRAGRVNPWSRTIEARPDRRDELSTRLTEPVNHRPRRHLFGYRHERAASGFQVGDHAFLSLSTGRLVVESRHGGPPCRLTESAWPPRLSTRVVVRLRDGSTHAPSIRLRTCSLDRTCRGFHLLRSGLAAFNDCITKYALRSERCAHDVVAHRDPTTAERRSTRLVPHPVADGRRR